MGGREADISLRSAEAWRGGGTMGTALGEEEKERGGG